MKIFIDDKEYSYDSEDLYDLCIGEGTEGFVYKIKNSAVKIYHKYSRKERLDEDTCKYLTNIDTRRILLPRKLVYNENNEFIGYTTEYHYPYSLDNIKRLKISKLKHDLEQLKEDIILLSKYNVSIEDFFIENVLLEDGLYFVDPGSYKIEKNDKYLCQENLRKMNDFIINYVITKGSRISKKKIKSIKEKFQYDDFISDSLPNSNESTQNYIKKLVI